MSRLRMVMQGDPGFFGGALGLLARAAPKLARGIPGIGTAVTVAQGAVGIGRAIGAQGPRIFPQQVSAPVAFPTSLPPGVPASSPLGQQIIRRNPAAAVGTALAVRPPTTRSSSAIVGPVGPRSGHVPRGLFGPGRRRRRMNPTNIKALTRGLRRLKAFAKIAKRIVRLEARYKSPPKRGAFGKRKKR